MSEDLTLWLAPPLNECSQRRSDSTGHSKEALANSQFPPLTP